MNAQQFTKHLEYLGACQDAREWAEGKSWKEVYDSCHRGDWLLWLYVRSKDYNFQKVTLAKGLCANTIRHLLKDERSIKGVDAAIAFGKGEISIDELDASVVAALAASGRAADAANAAFAATSAFAAASAAASAASAAASAAAIAAADANAAKKQNQQMTADIVREVLPFEIWEF